MSEKWIDTRTTDGLVTAADIETSLTPEPPEGKVPSAKCVYDELGDVERQLHVINCGNSTPQWWGLRIVAEEPGAEVSMSKTGSPDAVSLLYSTDDGSTWDSFDGNGGTTVELTNVGDAVCFKAGASGNTKISKADSHYRTFTLSKRCGAYGNIMSLLDGTDAETATAATMDDYCFRCLFRGQSNLVHAPDLPAMTVGWYGYDNMFRGCSSLATAPALPATSINPYAYRSMFYECTALSSPVEIAAEYPTYNSMNYLFAYCTSLTEVTAHFTQWTTSANYEITANWMIGVDGTVGSGTFKCPAGLRVEYSRDRIPTGWTVVNI